MSDVTSFSSVLGEVQSKVLVMKKELERKMTALKDLQSEIARLGVAKQKRREKCQRQWESRLQGLVEEQDILRDKQNRFIDKMSAEIKQLSEKKEALHQKSSKFNAEKEQTVVLTREAGQRKRDRTRRQWESDEKAVFEKTAQSKAEAMRKMAADAIGPRLDKMVSEGKERVRIKMDEGERRMTQLRYSLQTDLETKLGSVADRLKDELVEEGERVARRAEKRLEDTGKRHEVEVEEVQQRGARERRAAEELFERGRRIEAEAALGASRAAREAEAKQVEHSAILKTTFSC
jgi:hypothetical protein